VDYPDGDSKGTVEMSAAWTELFSGDDDLLRRWRSGDERAFDDLVLRYYRPVYRVLQGVVGSPQEAEDLAQETFLVLYRNPPRLEGAGFGPWVYRMAANRGYNALRSARRDRQHMEQASDAAAPGDPQCEFLRQEERQRVRGTLARLPERSAKLLLLRYGGLSYAEIACALEIAPSSVGTLLARAERAFVTEYEAGQTAEREGCVDEMSIRVWYDEGVLRSFLDDALPAAERTVSAAASTNRNQRAISLVCSGVAGMMSSWSSCYHAHAFQNRRRWKMRPLSLPMMGVSPCGRLIRTFTARSLPRLHAALSQIHRPRCFNRRPVDHGPRRSGSAGRPSRSGRAREWIARYRG
jgi:RNA polymerase sigma-70 factor (ECF subfamily)